MLVTLWKMQLHYSKHERHGSCATTYTIKATLFKACEALQGSKLNSIAGEVWSQFSNMANYFNYCEDIYIFFNWKGATWYIKKSKQVCLPLQAKHSANSCYCEMDKHNQSHLPRDTMHTTGTCVTITRVHDTSRKADLASTQQKETPRIPVNTSRHTSVTQRCWRGFFKHLSTTSILYTCLQVLGTPTTVKRTKQWARRASGATRGCVDASNVVSLCTLDSSNVPHCTIWSKQSNKLAETQKP